MIGSSAAAVMFYMKGDGMNRWVWLAGGGITVLTVWPSALLFMGRDINKKLNEENVIMTEGNFTFSKPLLLHEITEVIYLTSLV